MFGGIPDSLFQSENDLMNLEENPFQPSFWKLNTLFSLFTLPTKLKTVAEAILLKF